jgi:DNA-binding response OmpR family regulator
MPPQAANRHILLAEDNPADEVLVREALREHGVTCDLHVVKDGDQAISFILNLDSKGADEPRLDLLLLDMHLPRRDGADILRALRSTEHHSQKPVIVMSSSGSTGLRNTALEHDALYFFHKPSSLDEFMLLGGIVKGVLAGLTQIAGGGA